MAHRLRPRVVLVAAVAVVTAASAIVATPAGASRSSGFSLPMDYGTRMVHQLAAGRSALSHARSDAAEAHGRATRAQHHVDDLDVKLGWVTPQEHNAAAAVRAARARVASVAARQYMEAGGTRVNAAIDVAMDAGDVLTLGRTIHILETSSSYELGVYEIRKAAHDVIAEHLQELRGDRDRAHRELVAAEKQEQRSVAAVARAESRISDARAGIRRFFRAATSASSPIMGPSLLSAHQLAAFVRANGAHPRLTVSLNHLASIYIDEGQKAGIRGDVAFAQSIVETGWFEFDHSMVNPTDNNFAGVGACDTCSQGFHFNSARTGVRAQMQLLRIYVDRSVRPGSLPDRLLLPGTLHLGFRGQVQSWADLTGRWATASNYGRVIYAVYSRMVASRGGR
jgi:hypothetical protein